MRHPQAAQLEVLLHRYELRRQAGLGATFTAVSDHQPFLRRFRHLKRRVIRPAMEEIGARLRLHGHDYRLCDETHEINHIGRIRKEKIVMELRPAGIGRAAYGPFGYPSLAFIAEEARERIALRYRNLMPAAGGSAGLRREFRHQQVTREAVEREILSILEDIFDDGR